MQATDVARRRVSAVDPQRVVVDVAQLMTAEGVRAVVVVEGGSPVGIVTDRDLVTRVLALGLAPDTPIGSVMTADPVTVDGGEPVEAVQTLLRRHGIRQVPLTHDGLLVGIVTLDDLVYELNTELRRLLPESTQTLAPSFSKGSQGVRPAPSEVPQPLVDAPRSTSETEVAVDFEPCSSGATVHELHIPIDGSEPRGSARR